MSSEGRRDEEPANDDAISLRHSVRACSVKVVPPVPAVSISTVAPAEPGPEPDAESSSLPSTTSRLISYSLAGLRPYTMTVVSAPPNPSSSGAGPVPAVLVDCADPPVFVPVPACATCGQGLLSSCIEMDGGFRREGDEAGRGVKTERATAEDETSRTWRRSFDDAADDDAAVAEG